MGRSEPLDGAEIESLYSNLYVIDNWFTGNLSYGVSSADARKKARTFFRLLRRHIRRQELSRPRTLYRVTTVPGGGPRNMENVVMQTGGTRLQSWSGSVEGAMGYYENVLDVEPGRVAILIEAVIPQENILADYWDITAFLHHLAHTRAPEPLGGPKFQRWEVSNAAHDVLDTVKYYEAQQEVIVYLPSKRTEVTWAVVVGSEANPRPRRKKRVKPARDDSRARLRRLLRQ